MPMRSGMTSCRRVAVPEAGVQPWGEPNCMLLNIRPKFSLSAVHMVFMEAVSSHLLRHQLQPPIYERETTLCRKHVT